MGHVENNENLSPVEKQFRELMHQGDDFFKIEIFRNAIKYYKQAATLGVDDELAEQKVKECQHLLNKERRVIYVIGAIAVVVIILAWLL